MRGREIEREGGKGERKEEEDIFSHKYVYTRKVATSHTESRKVATSHAESRKVATSHTESRKVATSHTESRKWLETYCCHSPDVADVRNSLLSLEVAKREAGTLPHNAVLVVQQSYQVVHDRFVSVASASEGDGSHSSDIGVVISEQLDQSLHHGWVLELSCG